MIRIVEAGSDTVTDTDEVTFAIFWLIYPRHVARKDAERAWNKVKPVEHVALLTALVGWRKCWEARGEPEFVPHAATWLNGERWTDELPREFQYRAPRVQTPAPTPTDEGRTTMPDYVKLAIAKLREGR